MKAEIKETIAKIFNEVFGEDMDKCWDSSLTDSEITSLKFIKFTVAFEDEFDTEVENQYLDLNQYKTVSAMIETLSTLIEQ